MTTTLGDSLRLARLIRTARDLELTEATRATLRQLLLAQLGAPAHMVPYAQGAADDVENFDRHHDLQAVTATQPHAIDHSTTTTPFQDHDHTQNLTTPGPRAGAQSAPVFGQRTDHIELKLRQLVEAGADWERLQPLAWELFGLRQDDITAAHIVELAFLHHANDLEAILIKLKQAAPDFLRRVHAAVRAHLIAASWHQGGGALVSLLFRDKDEAYLQPIERLFIFHGLSTSRDLAAALIYFRRYRQVLCEAAHTLGLQLGLTLSRLLLRAGTLAMDLGYDQEARELLEQIQTSDPEYDAALSALLNAAADQAKAGRSHYANMLLQQSDARARLKLLDTFLTATRGLGGFRDRNRPALNEILKNPLQWFDEDPAIYGDLSELLVRNRDLQSLLPNLFELFRSQASTFHSPVVDGALWQGPLMLAPATAREAYFRGVALLHQYVNCGQSAEGSLWQARELIMTARQEAHEPLPFDWKDLHKAAKAWIAKNHYLTEPDRQRLLLQLKIALDPNTVVTADVEDYLNQTEAPPVSVLAKLERLAQAKGAPVLESRLLLKRAQLSHLTNADLNRYWQLANERQDGDLAWRVASVLQCRGVLLSNVRHAWEISGERRSSYEFVPPAKAAIERLLKGLPPSAARLASACLHIGPVLPELLAILDDGARLVRTAAAPQDSIEASADKLLSSLSWLTIPRKRYIFSGDTALGLTPVPSFAQKLPANPWAILVAKLAERLGANAWGFKLSRLHAQTCELIPRIAARQDLRQHSGKVAKWLKDLNSEQRAAWSELTQLTRSLDDDAAEDALAMFICRLATLIFQNHPVALSSLQAMRARVAVIWDLERFLISDSYSDLRKNLDTQNRVLVPNALKRLTSILQPS